jgi:hypothetical protein
MLSEERSGVFVLMGCLHDVHRVDKDTSMFEHSLVVSPRMLPSLFWNAVWRRLRFWDSVKSQRKESVPIQPSSLSLALARANVAFDGSRSRNRDPQGAASSVPSPPL